jgi:hypothetical protein
LKRFILGAEFELATEKTLYEVPTPANRTSCCQWLTICSAQDSSFRPKGQGAATINRRA